MMPLPKQMQDATDSSSSTSRASASSSPSHTRASRLVRSFVPRSSSSPSTVHLHASVCRHLHSFIHSFPSSGRATCPTDRDGGAHARVFCVSRVCPTDRPSIEPASERSVGRSIARLGGRSRRVVSHSDESPLVVKAHPRRRDGRRDATHETNRPRTRRRWVGSGSIRSDRRARVTRAWTGTSTRLARRDG